MSSRPWSAWRPCVIHGEAILDAEPLLDFMICFDVRPIVEVALWFFEVSLTAQTKKELCIPRWCIYFETWSILYTAQLSSHSWTNKFEWDHTSNARIHGSSLDIALKARENECSPNCTQIFIASKTLLANLLWRLFILCRYVPLQFVVMPLFEVTNPSKLLPLPCLKHTSSEHICIWNIANSYTSCKTLCIRAGSLQTITGYQSQMAGA